MKRLIALCIAISAMGCKEEPKDYATISGKIENADDSGTLRIFQGRNFEKTITLNEDGTFKDTLKVVEGDYTFQHGKRYGQIYLKNDNESSFTIDNDNFIETIKFEGDASDINNFSVEGFKLGNTYFTEDLIVGGKQKDLDEALKNYKKGYEELKAKYPEVDSIHLAIMDRNVKRTEQQVNSMMASRFAIRKAFPIGSESPKFTDYENHKGGKTSLDDLKGKYVYLDIWATWCGPCIKEIPSLKDLEKQYEGNNIKFVSISVDEGRGYKGDAKAAYEGWRKMVEDQELGGIQLMADNGFQSDFIRTFQINSIPRFILIDPEGNIVDADAPRPSNPKLIEMFDELGI